MRHLQCHIERIRHGVEESPLELPRPREPCHDALHDLFITQTINVGYELREAHG